MNVPLITTRSITFSTTHLKGIMMTNNDLPYELKEKLLNFAQRLPETKRQQFLTNTCRDIVDFSGRFIRDHKYSIVYGAIGYVVGHLLDQATTVTVPLVGIFRPFSNTFALFGLVGVGYGFLKDQEIYWFENILKRNIREALQ